MRPVCLARRQNSSTILVYESSDAVDIVDLSRDKYFKATGKADKTPVEHPVSRPRQGNTIIYDIRAILLDWPDMRCVNLGPFATVDELKACDCAALIIGAKYNLPKYSVAHDAARHLLQTPSFRFRGVWRLLFSTPRNGFGSVKTRQHLHSVVESLFNNRQEIRWRDRPYSRLRTAR